MKATESASPLWDWSQVKVSWITRTRGVKFVAVDRLLTLREVVHILETDDRIKGATEKGRRLYQPNEVSGGQAYHDLKLNQPAVVCSIAAEPGTPVRGIQGPHSRIFGFDVDEGDLDIPAAIAALQGDTHVILVGHSFSGAGLWVFVAGPPASSAKGHRALWAAIEQRLPAGLSVNSGDSSKNINRNRFAAAGTPAHINWQAVPWTADELLPAGQNGNAAKSARTSNTDAPRTSQQNGANPHGQSYSETPLTDVEVRWIADHLHRLPLPGGGTEGYNRWVGILSALKNIGVDAATADNWSATGGYPAGETTERWETIPDASESSRHSYNIIAKALLDAGADGQPQGPGSGIDQSIQCSAEELAWVVKNYASASCNEKNRVDRAAVFRCLGVSVDQLVAWVQEKQELNDTGADRYRSELEAALPPEMSERKTYQLASRWLKDAGVGGQPDRPNRPTARQQAKGNAERMTADDVDAGYVGRGAPYSHADCAPIATAMRYLAQNRHDTLLVLDQKGAGYIYCDNGSGIWQPNSGLVWHRIARQAMAWGDRGMELVKAKSNEDAAKAIASYQKWLGGPRAWEEIEKSFAAAYRSLQADYPDQIAGLTTCLPEDLDADTSVLGARNGVVDLDTGKLLPRAQGRPKLVTMTVPDEFDPDAEHPLVEGITEHLPDDLRNWAWGNAAWSLRGQPGRRIIVLEGPTGSGKSTFANAIRGCLGDHTLDQYGVALSNTALVADRLSSANSHSEHLVGFPRGRIAVSSDLENRKMNVGLLKTASGGDPLPTRGLREKFGPARAATATLFVVLNEGYSRNFDLSDTALVGRLLIAPWPKRTADEDPSIVTMVDKDQDVRKAVLAKLVRIGARMTAPPETIDSVRTFTRAAVSRGMDGLTELALSIHPDPGAWLTTDDVWSAACRMDNKKPDADRAMGLGYQQLITRVRQIRGLDRPSRQQIDGEKSRGWSGWSILEAE